MFRVNNKDTGLTPMASPYSSVSIVNFEQVNTGYESFK